MIQVLVTGIGVISAIGNNCNENFQNLKDGKSGIGKATHFQSIYTDSLPFAEVKLTNAELANTIGVSEDSGYTRTCLLSEYAFEQAIQDAQLGPKELTQASTALISASTVGGMCLTDQLYEDANLHAHGSVYLDSYGCSAHTLKIIKRHGITGYSNTINTACSSSANAIMLGARLIKSGRVKRAIVGGVDSLAKYTVNGFNALKILSALPCKPFDETRDGLNLGEGAGYLVLENAEDIGNKNVYGSIAGYGNSNDAYHPSSMSDNAVGAIKSMRDAILKAGISPEQIDYVNTHGTGTLNNDIVEMYGLSQVFDKIPYFNSTKSYTGHTLGAAGVLEAIFSLLSLRNRTIFKSLNCHNPIVGFETTPTDRLIENQELNFVLSNSFGFGGNCTSLILGQI